MCPCVFTRRHDVCTQMCALPAVGHTAVPPVLSLPLYAANVCMTCASALATVCQHPGTSAHNQNQSLQHSWGLVYHPGRPATDVDAVLINRSVEKVHPTSPHNYHHPHNYTPITTTTP